VILVTGFEPFGMHAQNPSQELAKQLDGRIVGGIDVRGAVLPVRHDEVGDRMEQLLDALDPLAIVHLGLAEGRARIAVERIALNVMDFSLPDNAGYCATDEPCVAGGPVAYGTSLPSRAIVEALVADGIPAYLSNTAGTYLCNLTLYRTLHAIARDGRRTRAGFVHLPLTPAMVAGRELDCPSMDLPLMLRAVEIALAVVTWSVSRPEGT
jgi:pyroglutamyl-peptidase